MDIEFLVISLNVNNFQEPQSHIRNSQFDCAIQEANFIGLLICIIYILKLSISLIFWEDIENQLFQYIAILITMHDIIAMCHFAVFNATSYSVKYSQINDLKSPTIFKLGTSFILIFLQEIWSKFRPLNGFVILYAIQQKHFKNNMIFLELLYYFNTILIIYIQISDKNEKPNLIKFYQIVFFIQWIITITLSLVFSIIYIIGKIKHKEFEFEFQKNLLNIFADKITELQYKNLQRDSNIECAICVQEFQEQDTIIQLPCHQNHVFHSQCCKQWLMKDNRCPLCRIYVEN